MFRRLFIVLFANFFYFFISCDGDFSTNLKDLNTLENTYTVSFQLNDGIEIQSVTLENSGKIARPINPSKFKQNFIDWYKEKEFINLFDFDKEIIKKDTVIYGRFEQQNHQQIKLQESDKNSTFGSSVAIKGDIAVIGEPNSTKNTAGGVYIFEKDDKSSWLKKKRLQAADSNNKDDFGYSVATDGNTIVVGAPGDESKDTGAVYVFFRSGDNWSQQAKLLANNKQVGALFGYSVALQNDTIVIGAPGEDTPEKNLEGYPSDGKNVGAVYIFTRNGNFWNQKSKLQATSGKTQHFGFEREEYTYFGNSVAIDNGTIVVGAFKDVRPSLDGKSVPINEGSVYIFVGNSGTWKQQAWLQADDKKSYDHFGNAVAIKGDMILIGAYNVGNSLAAIDYGAAYIFNRSGDTWMQQVKIEASDKSEYAFFGTSLAIVKDDIVVIGADGFDNVSFSRVGAAYFFAKEDSTWKETLKIQADDKNNGDHFGSSVGVDGSTLIFGAPGKEGSAYIW